MPRERRQSPSRAVRQSLKNISIGIASSIGKAYIHSAGNPAEPKMKDFGILASLDPVALDRACVDMVFDSKDNGKDDLIERINSRHGTHILTAAEKLGLGSQKYNLVTITEKKPL